MTPSKTKLSFCHSVIEQEQKWRVNLFQYKTRTCPLSLYTAFCIKPNAATGIVAHCSISLNDDGYYLSLLWLANPSYYFRFDNILRARACQYLCRLQFVNFDFRFNVLFHILLSFKIIISWKPPFHSQSPIHADFLLASGGLRGRRSRSPCAPHRISSRCLWCLPRLWPRAGCFALRKTIPTNCRATGWSYSCALVWDC